MQFLWVTEILLPSFSGVMKSDRISSMPDDVLVHIISFLDTRSAIRTGVLSNRWQFLWTRCNSIRIDERQCWPDSVKMIKKDPTMSTRRINSAIDAILQSHTTFNLEVFDICFLTSLSGERKSEDLIGEHQEYLDRWIHHVTMTKNIKDLSISFRDHFLPESGNPKVFFHMPSCKSITRLHLCGVSVRTFDSFDGFPSIKDLSLKDCFVSPRWLKNITSCPSLQRCVMVSCYLEGDLRLSAPGLKFLEIGIVGSLRKANSHEICLKIDAPSLEYLSIECCDQRVGRLLLRNMRSLITLILYGFFDKDHLSYFIPQNLTELSCVKELQMMDSSLLLGFHRWRNGNAAGNFVGQLHSLKHLTLHYCQSLDQFCALISFLDLAPNIQKLMITNFEADLDEDFESLDGLCCGSLKNLKTIHVTIATRMVLCQFKFLLKWASSLQLLEVSCFSKNNSADLALERELLALQRDGTPKICFTYM